MTRQELSKVGEVVKYDSTEKDPSQLTWAGTLFLMGNGCLRPALFLATFIDRTNGRDYVISGVDRSRPDCGVHRKQASKQERGGHPVRHPVGSCRRFCRRLVVPHLWSLWSERSQSL